MQIESAKGFLWVREIAEASPRLQALIFGPGDYSATMQMPVANIGELDENDHLYPGHRWHAVMHAVVAAARANGLRAIDGPYAGYRDTSGLERASRIARVMGFDGKQCIHPSQLSVVNRDLQSVGRRGRARESRGRRRMRRPRRPGAAQSEKTGR